MPRRTRYHYRLRLDPREHEALGALADRRGVPRTTLVLEALEALHRERAARPVCYHAVRRRGPRLQGVLEGTLLLATERLCDGDNVPTAAVLYTAVRRLLAGDLAPFDHPTTDTEHSSC